MSLALWIAVSVGIVFPIALIIVSVIPTGTNPIVDDAADDIYPANLLHDGETYSS